MGHHGHSGGGHHGGHHGGYGGGHHGGHHRGYRRGHHGCFTMCAVIVGMIAMAISISTWL